MKNKDKIIETILEQHYPSHIDNPKISDMRMNLKLVLESNLCEPKSTYPLSQGHICFKDGHNMQPVCSFQHERFGQGLNKCSRCGYEENWQFDF